MAGACCSGNNESSALTALLSCLWDTANALNRAELLPGINCSSKSCGSLVGNVEFPLQSDTHASQRSFAKEPSDQSYAVRHTAWW